MCYPVELLSRHWSTQNYKAAISSYDWTNLKVVPWIISLMAGWPQRTLNLGQPARDDLTPTATIWLTRPGWQLTLTEREPSQGSGAVGRKVVTSQQLHRDIGTSSSRLCHHYCQPRIGSNALKSWRYVVLSCYTIHSSSILTAFKALEMKLIYYTEQNY